MRESLQVGICIACWHDSQGQEKRKLQIERALLEKAKEVGESIDPNVPVTFGIAPLPDPVYDVSAGIEAYLLQFNADEGAGA